MWSEPDDIAPGPPIGQYDPRDLPAWLAPRIEILWNGCWRYKLKWNSGKGYSKLRSKGVAWLVHRYVWTKLVGYIRDGLVLDHAVCKWRGCCNPDHLESVTVGVNTHRGAARLYCRTTPLPKPALIVDNTDRQRIK